MEINAAAFAEQMAKAFRQEVRKDTLGLEEYFKKTEALEKRKLTFAEKEEQINSRIAKKRMEAFYQEESFRQAQAEKYGNFFKVWNSAAEITLQKEKERRAQLIIAAKEGQELEFKDRLEYNSIVFQDINDKIAKTALVQWNKQQGFFGGLGTIFKGVFVDPLLLVSKGISNTTKFLDKTEAFLKADWKTLFGKEQSDQQKQTIIQQEIKKDLQLLINRLEGEKKAEEEKKQIFEMFEDIGLEGKALGDLRKHIEEKERFGYKELINEWRKDNNFLIKNFSEPQLELLNEQLSSLSEIEKINKEGNLLLKDDKKSEEKDRKTLQTFFARSEMMLGKIAIAVAAATLISILGIFLYNVLDIWWNRKGAETIAKLNPFNFGKGVQDAFISKGGTVTPISDSDNILAFKQPTTSIQKALESTANNETLKNIGVSPVVKNNINLNNDSLAEKLDRLNSSVQTLIEITKATNKTQPEPSKMRL